MLDQILMVQCEICESVVARTTPGRLRMPIDSTMFDAIDVATPHPWPWPVTWPHLRCPICSNGLWALSEAQVQDALESRSGPDYVVTPLGRYTVGSDRLPGDTDPVVTEGVLPVQSDDELSAEWQQRMAATGGAAGVSDGPGADPPDATPSPISAPGDMGGENPAGSGTPTAYPSPDRPKPKKPVLPASRSSRRR